MYMTKEHFIRIVQFRIVLIQITNSFSFIHIYFVHV